MALAKLFGGGKKAAPAKEKTEAAPRVDDFSLYPPRARNGLDPKKMDEFAKRLAAFRKCYLAQREGQKLGSLQIYRFDRIRLRLGRRWESTREKVLSIIENALARQLGKDDVFVAVSEVEYYVLITSVGRQDAEIRGSRLAIDITGKLLGTLPGGAGVQFKTMLFDIANGLDGVTTFTQLKERIEAFGRSADDTERMLFQTNCHRLRVHYKPTIQLQKNLIAFYDMLIRSEEDGGLLMGPEAICPGSVNGVFDALLDEWALQRAGEALGGKLEHKRAQLVVPIHYETLAAMRFRDNFVVACRRLPKSSSRQLVFHFCDLSPGVPQSRVRELAAYLRPFCSGLVATLPPNQIYTEHLQNSGVKAALLDISTLDPDDPDVDKKLQTFVASCRSSHIRPAVTNAWSVKLSHKAMNLGINYLNGDALMKPIREPSKVIAIPKR